MRELLPNRRAHELFDFEHDGHKFTASVSRYADGRPGEIFINSRGKSGSQAETNAKDAAIAASFALQFGADVEALRRALCRDGNGRASGPLGAALDRVAGGGQ